MHVVGCHCSVLLSFACAIGGAMAPVSNPPQIASPDSTAVPPPPPPGGVAAAVSQSATDRQTSSSLEIKHPVGKGIINRVVIIMHAKLHNTILLYFYDRGYRGPQKRS